MPRYIKITYTESIETRDWIKKNVPPQEWSRFTREATKEAVKKIIKNKRDK